MNFLIFLSFFVLKLAHLLDIKECEIDEKISEYVNKGRLPIDISPTAYGLSFVFDETLSSYKGLTSITFTSTLRTDVIILHADQFSIEEIAGFQYNENHPENIQRIELNEICMVKTTQFLVLKLNVPLEKDAKGYLYFEFSGKVSSKTMGIASYNYLTKDQISKYLFYLKKILFYNLNNNHSKINYSKLSFFQISWFQYKTVVKANIAKERMLIF